MGLFPSIHNTIHFFRRSLVNNITNNCNGETSHANFPKIAAVESNSCSEKSWSQRLCCVFSELKSFRVDWLFLRSQNLGSECWAVAKLGSHILPHSSITYYHFIDMSTVLVKEELLASIQRSDTVEIPLEVNWFQIPRWLPTDSIRLNFNRRKFRIMNPVEGTPVISWGHSKYQLW